MATPVQRKAARTVGAGVVVLAVLFATFYMTFQAQTGIPFVPATIAKAAIGDVHSLRVNDDVRSNSLRIGRVSALDYAPDKTAIVTMELEGDFPVHNDAFARIWDYSPLATKFVELDPGNPASGPLGERVLPVTQSESSADLNQLQDVLDKPTMAATTSMLREFGGGLAGHSKDLNDVIDTAPRLLSNVETVTRDLASRPADLPALLRSANSLTGHLAAREKQIASLIDRTDTTFQAITTDNAVPLQRTLDLAPETLSTVRPALDRLNQPLADTQGAMSTLEPGAVALGQATPDVRGILTEGVPVVNKIPEFSDAAEPALKDLTPTLADLRPLAPPVVETFDSLAPFLKVLAPYAPETGQLFVRLASFVGNGPEPGKRVARVSVSPQVASGANGLAPTFFPQDTYPEPGESQKQRTRPGTPPPGTPTGAPTMPGTRGTPGTSAFGGGR